MSRQRWSFRTVSAESDLVAGARVFLRAQLGRREAVQVEGESDGEGHCVLDLDVPDGVARSMWVAACAMGVARVLGLGTEPSGTAHTLGLHRTLKVTGCVVDDEGAPVAGAQVWIDPHLPQVSVSPWPPAATTGADGSYEYPWLDASAAGDPAGCLVLRVQHPDFVAFEHTGFEPVLTRDGGLELDVRLQRGADTPREAFEPEPRSPIRFVVRRGGEPVEGEVALQLRDVLHFAPRLHFGFDGTTPEAHLPLGTYNLVVQTATGSTAARRITVRASRATRTFRLRVARGCRVTGRVTDTSGQPVAGCCVHASQMGSFLTPGWRAQTDAAGRYELSCVHGPCILSFQAIGFAMRWRLRWIRWWFPWRRRVDAVLHRCATVSGLVRDEAGRPLAGVPVILHGHGPGPQPVCGHQAFTDAEGRFTLPQIPPGPATISARGHTRAIHCTGGEALEVDFPEPDPTPVTNPAR